MKKVIIEPFIAYMFLTTDVPQSQLGQTKFFFTVDSSKINISIKMYILGHLSNKSAFVLFNENKYSCVVKNILFSAVL